MKTTIPKISKSLLLWYAENKRVLPWRANKNPYFIWVSEIMLQQTTVTAVVPFFDRFIAAFPTVESLAAAPQEKVLELWAGLGYYSRARNLHQTAKQIAQTGFPKSAKELIQLKGFGPYTSHAVASIAFDEAVGVLDGNVIRILSRLFSRPAKWWTTKDKDELQEIAHLMAQSGPPSEINQAMMELGATVCTTHQPMCVRCPWLKDCLGYKLNTVKKLPLSKPKRQHEYWIWQPEIKLQKNQVAFVKNHDAPILKKMILLPGSWKKSDQKPKEFDFSHSITHHKIYVQIQKVRSVKKRDNYLWVQLNEVRQHNPSSLIEKTLRHLSNF